jgi:hypothetical protein
MRALTFCQVKFVWGALFRTENFFDMEKLACKGHLTPLASVNSRTRIYSKGKNSVAERDEVLFCCEKCRPAICPLTGWPSAMCIRCVPRSVCIPPCAAEVFFQDRQANLILVCGGSCNSGKMECCEITAMIPAGVMFPWQSV